MLLASFTETEAARVDPAYRPAIAYFGEPMDFSIFEMFNEDLILQGGFNVIDDLPVGLIAKVRADGTIDRSFTAESIPPGGAPGVLPTLAEILPNGVIYVTRREEDPVTGSSRTFVRRTFTDGRLDESFAVPCIVNTLSVVVLPSGKLLLSGDIDYVHGVPTANVVRLNVDGSIDAGFQPPATVGPTRALVDDQGRIIIGSREGGKLVFRRLLPAGEVDPAFAQAEADDDLLGFSLFPDGGVLVAGEVFSINGTACRVFGRINPDGNVATGFPAPNNNSSVMLDVRAMADGAVVYITHQKYENLLRLGRVPADGGSAIETFVPLAFTISPKPSAHITRSGRIVVFARDLSELDGHPVHGMGRLSPDGTFDPTFPSRVGRAGTVRQIIPLSNERAMIVGTFSLIGGEISNGVAILDSTGSVLPESEFSYGADRAREVNDGSFLFTGNYLAPDGDIHSRSYRTIRVTSDGTRDPTFEARFPYGSWLVETENSDDIYLFANQTAPAADPVLKRLHSDLSEDTVFRPPNMTNLKKIIRLPDGRLLVWSNNFINGDSVNSFVMLHANGQSDASFTQSQIFGASVSDVALASGGKIYVGGSFGMVHGARRDKIARLNGNGTLDTSFVPPAFPDPMGKVRALLVQPDGKVIVGGDYRTPQTAYHQVVVARLNTDGTLDGNYVFLAQTLGNANINDLVYTSHNDILVGGQFWGLDGTPVGSLARITELAFHAQIDPGYLEIAAGSTGFLRAMAADVEPTAYQWLHNGGAIAGANRPVLALRDFTATDAGDYRVRISAANETHTSAITTVALSNNKWVRALGPTTFSRDGGFSAIRIDAPATAAWSISEPPSWVSIAPVATMGSQTVALSLASNDTGTNRSTVIEIAGESFLIEQLANGSRLANISTRGVAGTGANTLIVGFFTKGSQPLEVLSRGVGPSLSIFGLDGLLPDPVISLNRGQQQIDFNGDWDEGLNRDEVLSESRRVGAFGLLDGKGDAALLAALSPGGYTALITDSANRGGIALVELYDRTPSASASPSNRIVNVSTRGHVGIGADILIAGFYIVGPGPKEVLIRGIGPGLHRFDLENVLADPKIQVYRNGAKLLENDDWGFSEQSYLLTEAFKTTGAFGLDIDSRDAALIATLPPGGYTVLFSGVGATTGLGLVEVYDLE